MKKRNLANISIDRTVFEELSEYIENMELPPSKAKFIERAVEYYIAHLEQASRT